LSHITFSFLLPAAVFGPNDAAFTALGASFAELAADETAIAAVLAGHVVAGEYTAADVKAAGCVELVTLAETKIKVTYTADGMVMVNGAAMVVDADFIGEDGIFHGIDSVILPGSFTPCPTGAPSAASVVSTSVAMVAAVAAIFAF
jgi:uncharacterized surface protein with fasciclin (FAS1) repeats